MATAPVVQSRQTQHAFAPDQSMVAFGGTASAVIDTTGVDIWSNKHKTIRDRDVPVWLVGWPGGAGALSLSS